MLYSLLTSDRDFLMKKETVDKILKQGIKVLAFGVASDMEQLCVGREEYVKARLLQTYPVKVGVPVLTVEDGKMTTGEKKGLMVLAEEAKQFNYEQYLVEHADADNSVLVEAGAGTGKTTVMIDRVLFLLHTVPGLSLEEIGMITFTNEATQNMKHKIQAALVQRYMATQSARYLRFLEDSSKLHIQTIHSFSKGIINELGSSIGYAHSLALRSFKYEKQQLIRDVLNEKYLSDQKSLPKGLGAQLHELIGLILGFWTQLENIGLTDAEIAALDWGRPYDEASRSLHKTLQDSFIQLNERYNEMKMDEDAIAVGDIVRELRRILDSGTEMPIKNMTLRYLFVDEFQDSDNAQIKTIAWLHRVCKLKLFAVGDAKQSIYRFRGAVETAFDRLRKEIAKNTDIEPNEFSLIRNYRTSEDVLAALEPVFRSLERKKLLEYGDSLLAQKHHAGACNIRPVRRSNKIIEEETVKTLCAAVADCVAYAKANGKEDDPTQHVTVLTRTNYQLKTIGQWCAQAGIPCYIKREGTFYSSPAVRDIFCLIKAHLFPTEAIHLFEYLRSSYATVGCVPDEMACYEPGTAEQMDHLHKLLKKENWEQQQRAFRLCPVLSVLREIVDEAQPAARFVAKRKRTLRESGAWSENELSKQLALEASQYDADLEKLMEILRRSFAGQMATLYQIYSFLQINMQTNREESEPDVSGDSGCGCVYGMTVHKAKGLEFDTVVLPLTHRAFRRPVATELILDERTVPPKVGWSRVTIAQGSWNEVSSHQRNTYYENAVKKEFGDVDREEARLLYVALTRTIRKLECFVIGTEQHSWAHMLEG